MSDPINLFQNLGPVPAKLGNPAVDAQANAQYADRAADGKAVAVNAKLAESAQVINGTLDQTESNLAMLESGEGYLDLNDILEAYAHLYSPKQIRDSKGEIARKSAMKLTSGSAAGFGTVSEAIVRMSVDSTYSEASGDVRMQVARVLDTATGVAKAIKKDKNIQADAIKEKAKKIYANFENAKMVAALFEALYGMVKNRVRDHKNNLLDVFEDLGKKSVTLDGLAASLLARQQMVIDDLYNTCVNGIALDKIIETAKADLEDYREELAAAKTDAARGAINNKVSSQESLVSILIRRSIDLKSFAVTETGMITIIQKIYDAVNVVRMDVEFTRKNLIFTLGLTLGLIVDVVATIRISESTQNVRQAAADANKELGNASDAINELAKRVLTEIELTLDGVETTINAAMRAVESTHEGLNTMLDLQQSSGTRLNAALSRLGNA